MDTWKRTCIPFISISWCFLFGAGALYIGQKFCHWRGDTAMFYWSSSIIGAVIMIQSFFLTKTRLWVDYQKRTIVRTSGPWTGLWAKTHSIPLDSLQCIVHRRKTSTWRDGTIDTKVRLFALDTEGREHDLFLPNRGPLRLERAGRSLAEYLHLEFRTESNETVIGKKG